MPSNTLMPNSSAEVLMYAVKRLETFGRHGESWVGTGYACLIPTIGDRSILAFVTNKHVVENASRFDIHFHTGMPDPVRGIAPDGGSTVVSLTPTNSRLIPHPENLDLAAILIGSLLADWRSEVEGQRLFSTFIQPDDFWPEEDWPKLDVSEPVMMIGCPNGEWDDINKFPLFRRGSTATHPAIDYQGRPEFAADIAVFSGSSGSPVFLWDFGANYSKPSSDLAGKVKYGLLGTLWGGPRILEDGRVIAGPAPSEPMVVETGVRMHVGYVIKAREILRLFEAVREFVG